MEKSLNPEFTNDVFTFARLKFNQDMGYGYGRGRTWDDDTPDADLNLIFRLHDVTSLKVRPGLNYIDITAKDLANYPFVYLASGGRVVFSDEEVTDLRNYLLNGGFIMVDDFWGDDAWATLPNLKRWFDLISARPAAVRANALKDKYTFKQDMDAEARRNMFRHLATA